MKLIQSPTTGKYYPVNIAGESPTDDEKTRIAEYLRQREQPIAPPEEEQQYEARSGILGAFDVGTDYMGNQIGSTLEGIGKVLGIDSLENYGGEMAESYAESGSQKAEGLTRMGEVEGVGSGAKFVGEVLGQAAPQIGTAIAAGTGLALLAPALPFAAVIGGIAATLPLLYGANRERQKEADIAEGRPVEVDEGAAAITALGQSALESLSLRFLTLANKAGLKVNANYFKENPASGLFTKIVDKAPRTTRGVAGAASGASVESLTEAGQQMLERMQAGLDIGSDEALEEYLEAAVAGGIVGGTLKGGVSAISDPNAKKAKEDLQKKNELEEDDRIEGVQDQDAMANIRQTANAQDLKIQSNQEGVTNQTLSEQEIIKQTKQKTKEARPVEPDELTSDEKARLDDFRRARNIPLEAPITLQEIRSALGGQAVERLAFNQGMTGARTNYAKLSGAKPFSQEQVNKVINAVRKSKKEKLTEIEIDNLISGQIDSKSFELIEGIKNELIDQGKIRLTARQEYDVNTKKLRAIGKAEFKKTFEIEGEVAREANRLENESNTAKKDLEKKRKDIEELEIRVNRLEQMRNLDLYDAKDMDTAAKYLKSEEGDTYTEINVTDPQNIEQKLVASVSKRINKALGQKGDLKKEPTGLRKTLKDAKEDKDNLIGYIENTENALKFVNTSDFTTENLKYGKKVDPNEYNPEALDTTLKFKQRVLTEKVAENKRKAPQRSPEEKKAAREEVDKLRKDIKELKDAIANPPTPVQKDNAKNDGNAIRQAAKVTAKKRLKPRYLSTLKSMRTSLVKYLKKMNLANDIIIRQADMIDPDQPFITYAEEGKGENGKRIITVAMDLFDPDTVMDEEGAKTVYKRLKSTLNHEILHSLRELQLITETEYQSLVKAASTRKRVVLRDGKTVTRNYTYLDHAKHLYKREFFPNMTDQEFNDMVQEEAVAEMFRDVLDDKLPMTGKPRTLLNRIIEFFRSLFLAHQDNGITSVEQIFEDVRSGKIGDTREAKQKEGDRGTRLSISQVLTDAENNYESYKYKNKLFKETMQAMEKEGYKFDPITMEFLGMKEGMEIPPPLEHYVANLFTDRGLEFLQARHSGNRRRNLASLFQKQVGLRQAEIDRQPVEQDMSFEPNQEALDKIRFDLWKITQAQLAHLPDRIPIFRIGPVDSKNLYKGQMHSYSLSPNPKEMGLYKNRRSFAYKEYIKERKKQIGIFGRGQVEPEILGYLVDKEDIVVAPNLGYGDIFNNDPEQEVVVRPSDVMRVNIEEYENIYGKPDVKVRKSIGRKVYNSSDIERGQGQLEDYADYKENGVTGNIDFLMSTKSPTSFSVLQQNMADNITEAWGNDGFYDEEFPVQKFKSKRFEFEEYTMKEMLDDYNYLTALSLESVGNSGDSEFILEDAARDEDTGQINTELMNIFREYLNEAKKVSIRTAPKNEEFKRKSIGRLVKDPVLYNMSSLPDVDLNTLKFKTKIGQDDIERSLVEAVRDYYEERLERAGEDFRVDYTDPSPETLERIATIMAAEAELALARDGNAIGWYDNKLKLAKKLFAIVHPELMPDPETMSPVELMEAKRHEAVFDYALAVTSNGTPVIDNAKYAIQAYRSWVDTGKFEVRGYGDKVDPMKKAFEFYNAMIDRYQGNTVGIAEFLDEKLTVREIKDNEFIKQLEEDYGLKLTKNLSQETMDTEVSISALMGAKIGNGFYQNLRGNYKSLTMDRWWQRFYNRVTGNPYYRTQDKTKIKVYNQFIEQLKRPKRELPDIDKKALKLATEALANPLIKKGKFDGTVQEVDANVIALASAFAAERNRIYQSISNEGTEGMKAGAARSRIVAENRRRAGIAENTEMSKVANSMERNFGLSLQEMPRTGTERSYQRRATERAIKILEQDKIIKPGTLSMADFQALMWFHEKSLFKDLGIAQGGGRENDYVDGAIAVLREEGITDDNIQEALPTTDRFRVAGGVNPNSGNAEVRTRATEVSGKIQEFQEQAEVDQEIRARNQRHKDRVTERRKSIGRVVEATLKQKRTVEDSPRADVKEHNHKMLYTASANAIARALQGASKIRVIYGGKPLETAEARKVSDNFIRKIQDRTIPIARMIDELQEKGLKLTDAIDPILREQLMHGRVGDLLDTKQNGIYKAVLSVIQRFKYSDAEVEALKRVSREASDPDQQGYVSTAIDSFKPSLYKRLLYGEDSKQLVMAEAYLYALHAKERNDYVKRIDRNEINKNTDRGSGMSNTEADAIINWFDRNSPEGLLKDLQRTVQDVVADTNATRLEGELVPLFDRGSGWNNYVPLKGVFHAEDETQDYTNKGKYTKPLLGARGQEDTRVKGRLDYSPNILANLFTQNSTSTINSERNRVGLSMLNLIRKDPDMLREFAFIDNITPKRRVVDARTGVLSTRPVSNVEIWNDPNVLIVKEGGQEIVIRFNSPVIAGAFRGDTGQSVLPESVIRNLGKFNRFLSSINTSYNPAFIAPNFIRDVQTALVNIDQYEGDNLKKKVFADAWRMSRGVYRAEAKGDVDTEEAQLYRDFVKFGGKNVNNQMTTLEDQANDITKILNTISEGGLVGNVQKMRNGWVGKGTNNVLSFVENMNTAAENGVRVATYKALLDTGKYSQEQAALAARNITVNFAKGGEYKNTFNSLYLFFNASLQGSFALLNAFSKSAKVRKTWMGVFALGIMLDQLNALISDEDEEGMLEYDKITDYMLEHNIVIGNVGAFAIDKFTDKDLEYKTFATIPLPYGVNMAFNFGRALSRRTRGGYTGAEATSTIFSTTLEAVNPLGGAESIGNLIMPTVADPYVSLSQNTDYDGTPIYKEVSQFAVGTPDSQSYWNSASPMSVATAQAINALTGGSTVRKGLVDFSPDTLDYIFGYFTGGAGAFVQRTMTAGYKVTSGEAFQAFEDGLEAQEVREGIRQVPLVRKLVYSTSEREDTGKFIEKRNQVFIARKELKAAMQSGDRSEVLAVRQKYPDELKIYGIVRAINGKRQKLTAVRNKLLRMPKDRISDSERDRRLEILDKRIQKLIERGNAVMKGIDVPFLTALGVGV